MYRLLIADDERIECMVLEHIFQHEMHGQIEVLDSVGDGISLLAAVEEKQPDIAIVDINMPGLGGLEVIELLRAKQQKLKVIIHTAYSEFSYAQRAIQLGAADYLVKPNLKEEMIAAVKKVCCQLDEEAQQEKACVSNEETKQTLRDLAAGKWLMSLLLGQPDRDSYQVVRSSFPDALAGGIVTLWKTGAGEQQNASDATYQKGREVRFGQWDIRLNSLCSHASVQYEDALYCVLFPGERVKAGNWKDWLSQLVFCVTKDRKEDDFFADDWSVGVSCWKEEEEFLPGLHEAQTALWHRSKGGVFFYQEGHQGNRENLEKNNGQLFSRAAVQLRGYVLNHEKREGLEELLQYIRRLFVPDYFSQTEKRMVHQIGGAAFLLSMEEELEKLSDHREWTGIFWKGFCQIHTEEELSHWCSKKFLEACVRYEEPKETENPYIAHTCTLVAQNYAQELWLEGMAKCIGISPFYLSRLLKQEKAVTFVELVTDIRIRKAFILLVQSHKSIREIAALVGYPNQSYFYRVFKKTTGIAVGDIRKYLW